MRLNDLCGIHTLSGVDMCQVESRGFWEDTTEMVNAVRFTLDGVTYIAVEDPDDGYRSRCEELVISDESPKNIFPGQEVIGSMMSDDEDYKNYVLVLTDCVTGGVVLEVGTKNYDDWYPYCHFEYHPENMACNRV